MPDLKTELGKIAADHRNVVTQLIERAATFRAVRLTLRVETLDGDADPLMAETEVLASPKMISDVVAALALHMPKVNHA